jgi:CheY-like chemotaxis protein
MNLIAEGANGREAIQQFRAHQPDITLMDLQMPGMNGLDAMIAIRQEFPDARIIIVTTYDSDHLREQCPECYEWGRSGLSPEDALGQGTPGTIRAVHAGK